MAASAPARAEHAPDVFEALADPTRRSIIERLSSSSEPISISVLAEHYPVSRQAVSKHLHLLEQAGLVDVERSGRERLLSFSPRPLSNATRWIRQVEADWDRRLEALRDYLTDDATSQVSRTDPQ